MRDNDLIRLFLPIINTGLLAAGFSGVTTQQNFEPTQQGVNSGPTVYFYKLSDHRYGFLKRSSVWDADTSMMIHTEIQQYETTFQVSALVIEDPTITTGYTASDLVNAVAQIIQSDSTRATLTAAGVGIYRVMDVRNPYFTDDRGRYEASPSFDFTLTHKQISVTTDPVVKSTEFDIFRI